ncbi:hypothetical protein GCM10009745_61150 [Kribbella yunnanensis]|uniref:Uncharacterized protein n=1 Tax=Kribbella yunnanensis TaxID=190194 RepID=A0ABN2IHS9_9ACTN
MQDARDAEPGQLVDPGEREAADPYQRETLHPSVHRHDRSRRADYDAIAHRTTVTCLAARSSAPERNPR